MANGNKITQIIINQEPYTIGEDSAGFTTLTGSEMISTLKSGVYYIGAGENLVTVLLTIMPHRGNEYYVYAVAQNRIFIYDGVDTTLQMAFSKGYNILMSDTNMNTNIPIMRSDEYKLSEIGSNGFADIFGGSNDGFIIYDNIKFPEYQQLICLSAECKALKFQGSEETVLNTAVQTAEPFMAEEDEDIVTKKYLDTALSGAGGIPEYSADVTLADINSNIFLFDTGDAKYPLLYMRSESTVIALFIHDLYIANDVTDETTLASVVSPANAYLAVNDSSLVTKKFSDQTYTNKTDYNTLNSKVTELESTVATLTETISQLQTTIMELQGNSLTTLDRQTLDVIEGGTT